MTWKDFQIKKIKQDSITLISLLQRLGNRNCHYFFEFKSLF